MPEMYIPTIRTLEPPTSRVQDPLIGLSQPLKISQGPFPPMLPEAPKPQTQSNTPFKSRRLHQKAKILQFGGPVWGPWDLHPQMLVYLQVYELPQTPAGAHSSPEAKVNGSEVHLRNREASIAGQAPDWV